MIDYKEVGRRIRYYRRKRGFTQEQLAFEINTSAAYLSNIERAIKKPSLQKLIKISEILEISVNDLVSPGHTLNEYEPGGLERIVNLCSESDKKRLVDNLFEIINILERSSS